MSKKNYDQCLSGTFGCSDKSYAPGFEQGLKNGLIKGDLSKPEYYRLMRSVPNEGAGNGINGEVVILGIGGGILVVLSLGLIRVLNNNAASHGCQLFDYITHACGWK